MMFLNIPFINPERISEGLSYITSIINLHDFFECFNKFFFYFFKKFTVSDKNPPLYEINFWCVYFRALNRISRKIIHEGWRRLLNKMVDIEHPNFSKLIVYLRQDTEKRAKIARFIICFLDINIKNLGKNINLFVLWEN